MKSSQLEVREPPEDLPSMFPMAEELVWRIRTGGISDLLARLLLKLDEAEAIENFRVSVKTWVTVEM